MQYHPRADYPLDSDSDDEGSSFNSLSPRERQTWTRQSLFLSAYCKTGRILESAEAAGVSYNTVKYWRRHDLLGFNGRLEVAEVAVREKLERWVEDRLENPQGNRGSDLLLIFRTKAQWPEKYAQAESGDKDAAKELVAEIRKAFREAKAQSQLQQEQKQAQEGQDAVYTVEELLRRKRQQP